MNIDSHKCDNLSQFAQPQKSSHKTITIQGNDIDTIKRKTGCNEMTAVQALANENNNIEKAVMNIDKYRVSDNENEIAMKKLLPQTQTTVLNNSNSNENDIETIIDQTGCDKETAEKALKGENNDVIACIMNIDNYKNNNQQSEEGISLSVSE